MPHSVVGARQDDGQNVGGVALFSHRAIAHTQSEANVAPNSTPTTALFAPAILSLVTSAAGGYGGGVEGGGGEGDGGGFMGGEGCEGGVSL